MGLSCECAVRLKLAPPMCLKHALLEPSPYQERRMDCSCRCYAAC